MQDIVKEPFLGYRFSSLKELVKMLIIGDPILDINQLIASLKAICGNLTFREVHDKYQWILNINVTDALSEETKLLNFITSPNVLIWSAAAASSAVPNIFHPVELMIKN
mmetsp:Transcript_13789/g.9938  ORF Transcript_13789/g.9938 Transcript_13789/m.9938 type:complete len:109 (+) Transcript_13789:702-1028(+)